MSCRAQVDDGSLPRVAGGGTIAPRDAERAVPYRIGEQFPHGCRDSARSARGHEHSRDPVHDDVAQTLDRRRHHRFPARHCFERQMTERFARGRAQHHVGGVQQCGHLVSGRRPAEMDPVAHPEPVGELTQATPSDRRHRLVACSEHSSSNNAFGAIGEGSIPSACSSSIVHAAQDRRDDPVGGLYDGRSPVPRAAAGLLSRAGYRKRRLGPEALLPQRHT